MNVLTVICIPLFVDHVRRRAAAALRDAAAAVPAELVETGWGHLHFNWASARVNSVAFEHQRCVV